MRELTKEIDRSRVRAVYGKVSMLMVTATPRAK